jgi:hypothetical protein
VLDELADKEAYHYFLDDVQARGFDVSFPQSSEPSCSTSLSPTPTPTIPSERTTHETCVLF